MVGARNVYGIMFIENKLTHGTLFALFELIDANYLIVLGLPHLFKGSDPTVEGSSVCYETSKRPHQERTVRGLTEALPFNSFLSSCFVFLKFRSKC